MGVLQNQRHELFARALAEGQGSLEAYVSVGYKSNAANASNLAHKPYIKARIQEINNFVLQRTEIALSITRESLIREADEILVAALKTSQLSAATGALTAKAKLAGLWIERGDQQSIVKNIALTNEERMQILEELVARAKP